MTAVAFAFGAEPDSGVPSDAAAAPETVPSNYREADKLFDEIQDQEAEFSQNCLQVPKLAAQADEQIKNVDDGLEKQRGKRPSGFRVYPPLVEAVVCDPKVPYSKVSQFLADPKTRNAQENWMYSAFAIDENMTWAMNYYSCLALVQGVGACVPLKTVVYSTAPMVIPVDVSQECVQKKNCRFKTEPIRGEIVDQFDACAKDMHQYLLGKALITGDPSAERICLDSCRQHGLHAIFLADRTLRGDEKSCRTVCALAVKYRDRPELFCAQALPAVKRAFWAVKACRDRGFSALVGLGNGLSRSDMLGMINDPDPDKRACSPGRPCFQMQDVAAFAAFRKAFAVKDRELCGESNTCRAMMGGGPQACEPIAAAARWSVCGDRKQRLDQQEWDRARDAAVKEISGRRQEIEQRRVACVKRLDQIKALHDKIGELLTRPPSYPSKASRDERFSASWTRLRELTKQFLGGAVPSS